MLILLVCFQLVYSNELLILNVTRTDTIPIEMMQLDHFRIAGLIQATCPYIAVNFITASGFKINHTKVDWSRNRIRFNCANVDDWMVLLFWVYLNFQPNWGNEERTKINGSRTSVFDWNFRHFKKSMKIDFGDGKTYRYKYKFNERIVKLTIEVPKKCNVEFSAIQMYRDERSMADANHIKSALRIV
ncbi:unnamed protein product [Caenorhabditis bovis]|uniref:Uncharacterized protein n=1 Tax=Caenorhabditis bovis TaxID=2654633 RepID=A0A8S1F6X2_9PELO|nr:unnamed protein product [Caenorhabditis bovis]